MKLNFVTVVSLNLLILGLVSCNSVNRDQLALTKEVLQIHDEVMPKMDQIVDLQTRVAYTIESLQADSTNLDKRRLELAIKTMDELNDADAAMWDWMNAFKIPGKKDPRSSKEIMAYLNEKKTSIENVRDLMLSSIDNGNALLKENE